MEGVVTELLLPSVCMASVLVWAYALYNERPALLVVPFLLLVMAYAVAAEEGRSSNNTLVETRDGGEVVIADAKVEGDSLFITSTVGEVFTIPAKHLHALRRQTRKVQEQRDPFHHDPKMRAWRRYLVYEYSQL